MSDYDFDNKHFAVDDLTDDEFLKLQSKVWKKRYQSGMDKLFQLRQGNRTKVSSVPMPRLSLRAFINNPDILDCYIKIELWKRSGMECSKNELKNDWVPAIIIHGYNSRN